MSFVHRYFDSRVRIKLLRQFARDRHRGRDLHLSGSKLIQNIEEKIRTLDSRDSHDSPNIYRQLLTLLNLLRLQRLGFSIAAEFDTEKATQFRSSGLSTIRHLETLSNQFSEGSVEATSTCGLIRDSIAEFG